MILESLLELVETLKARIDTHGGLFGNSEAATRYGLIDPLLRELGWDTENPDMVRPEYPVADRKKADYVLLTNCRPTIVVESKKLGELPGDGKALDQVSQYCEETKSKYFLLSDGRRWELYKSGKTTPEIDLDLKSSSSADVRRKANKLRRSVFTSDSDVQPCNVGWTPLTIDIVTRGTKGMKPVELKFADGKCVKLERWADLMIKPIRWLFKKGYLTPDSLPIMRSGNAKNKTYAVSTTPAQLGKNREEVLNGIWVRTDYIPDNNVRNAIAIIKEAGQDPWEFRVCIDPGD